MEIEEAIKQAKIPGSIVCPECQEELFAPMDKLSIYLFGKCAIHLDDNSIEQRNLFKIAEALY